MQTLCTLSCHATSGSPFNYSWTKNGQVPGSDDIKIMNNIIVLTPRDAEDYGMYVCHATNSFGSTAYKITLSEGHKSSSSAFSCRCKQLVNVVKTEYAIYSIVTYLLNNVTTRSGTEVQTTFLFLWLFMCFRFFRVGRG